MTKEPNHGSAVRYMMIAWSFSFSTLFVITQPGRNPNKSKLHCKKVDCRQRSTIEIMRTFSGPFLVKILQFGTECVDQDQGTCVFPLKFKSLRNTPNLYQQIAAYNRQLFHLPLPPLDSYLPHLEALAIH